MLINPGIYTDELFIGTMSSDGTDPVAAIFYRHKVYC